MEEGKLKIHLNINNKMANLLDYIPLDKSWIIRMGILDITNGYEDIINFLKKQDWLGEDLLALLKVSMDWNTNNPLNVGESGTLYRFVKFALWKQGKEREIIKQGTLKDRKICDSQEIVNWPLEKLLDLDNGTSQWASASVLMGNKEKVKNLPNKLKLTYEAIEHWNLKRKNDLCWEPRYDETIERQAKAFFNFLKTDKMYFVPRHSEDYCFARAFGLITSKKGEEEFPSLIGHETNRIKEMEYALKEAKKYEHISSKDHRVVQAIAMKYMGEGIVLDIENPDSVNKSWPRFWGFLDEYCGKI